MSVREEIIEMRSYGIPDTDIQTKLGLTNKSFGAYKAHITRNNQNGIYNGLANYVVDKKITIEKSDLGKLNKKDVSNLEKILKKLTSDNGTSENGSKKSHSQKHPGRLTVSQIQTVIDLKDDGVENKKIYELFPKGYKLSVSAVISNYTRGNYDP